jgi:hypothetical protein
MLIRLLRLLQICLPSLVSSPLSKSLSFSPCFCLYLSVSSCVGLRHLCLLRLLVPVFVCLPSRAFFFFFCLSLLLVCCLLMSSWIQFSRSFLLVYANWSACACTYFCLCLLALASLLVPAFICFYLPLSASICLCLLVSASVFLCLLASTCVCVCLCLRCFFSTFDCFFCLHVCLLVSACVCVCLSSSLLVLVSACVYFFGVCWRLTICAPRILPCPEKKTFIYLLNELERCITFF